MTTQGQPRDRQGWEHWPGRHQDERPRGRLRSLFSPTDDETAIEALIAERGRELEERTEQLAATIADLERREERAREIRSTVEDMLRRGSAELDERHAELNELARELADREVRLAASESELAERKQELGAVELHRAAVERREEGIAEREAALERIAGELQERELRFAEIEGRERALAEELVRLAELQDAVAEAQAQSPEAADAHVVFVPGDRYRLVDGDGPPPEVGTRMEIDGAGYRVARVGASPLPGDRRPCVVVEPFDAGT
jgi:DNA repair exonuclease SbcCD ATPase subunit